MFHFWNWTTSAGTGMVPKWGPTYTKLAPVVNLFTCDGEKLLPGEGGAFIEQKAIISPIHEADKGL